jgi:hypothetical protein
MLSTTLKIDRRGKDGGWRVLLVKVLKLRKRGHKSSAESLKREMTRLIQNLDLSEKTPARSI